MLVNGRAEMVKRAIASFRAQTYTRKRLLIWNSGTVSPLSMQQQLAGDGVHIRECDDATTIGALRNRANSHAVSGESFAAADLIAHWDSDDWSHPQRLAEQVALHQASGKQLVGYRELLFWDSRPGDQDGMDALNEAWIYRHQQANWAAGASFLYTRALWEQQPFPDAPHEDQRWWLTPLVSRACVGISAIDPTKLEEHQCGGAILRDATGDMEPRMVCGIHGSNTEIYDRRSMLRGSDVWLRAPQWEEYCGKVMAL